MNINFPPKIKKNTRPLSTDEKSRMKALLSGLREIREKAVGKKSDSKLQASIFDREGGFYAQGHTRPSVNSLTR